MVNDTIIDNVIQFLSTDKVLFLVAPSFASFCDYKILLKDLRAIGATKILEVTFGAKIINEQYHKMIPESNHPWISSTCPNIVSLIKNKFPQYIGYLLPFISPMHAMAKIALKNYPEHKIIFLSPCTAKRNESDNYASEVDEVITFLELSFLIKKAKDLKLYDDGVLESELHFDSFYNDYTKIYPLTGGLKKSLHYKNILKEDQIEVVDGMADVSKVFSSELSSQTKFYDVLSCKGGCIGGPCLGTDKSLDEKKECIKEYLLISKERKIGGSKIGLTEYVEGISLEKEF